MIYPSRNQSCSVSPIIITSIKITEKHTYYSFSLMLIHSLMSILQTDSLTLQKSPKQRQGKLHMKTGAKRS